MAQSRPLARFRPDPTSPSSSVFIMSMNPRLLRPTANDSPASIPGLALWLDASAADALYTTDAGPVTAVSSPLDISGCALWLDASDASTISDTAGAVDEWIDKSGNDNHATASTTARPTTGTRTLNGRNVLDFDGTANFMLVASGPDFASAEATYFIVFASDVIANQGVYMKLNASVSTNGFGMATRTGSELWMYQKNGSTAAGLTLASGYAASTARVYSVVLGSSAQSGVRDGMVSATGTASISCDTELAVAIGARYAGGQEPLNGIIAEIIHYNTAISASDRARVEAYLAAKWGISGVHAPATTASDPVGYWRDRSGNGRHATQSTAASRPVVGAQNGRRALTFDGSNDFLGGAAAVSALPATVIAVAKFPSLKQIGFVYEQYAGTTDGLGIYRGHTNARGFRLYNGSDLSSLLVSSDSTPYILNAVFGATSSTSNLRINGAVDASGNAGTNTPASGRYYLGRWAGAGASPLGAYTPMDLDELLIYSRALSTAERRKVEVYLARRWGITLAPQVSNAEAQDWISRVYANGGTVSQSTASAVSTMCDAIESAGIRDRFYRLNLFCGSNLNAALVPLYRGPTFGGTTYGNATDTNVGPFVSGDYSESSGLQGNGSNKALNTGFPANTIAAASRHSGFGVLATSASEASAANRFLSSNWSGGSNSLAVKARSATAGDRSAIFSRFGTASDTFGDDVGTGALAAGNIVASWPTMYRNGVATGVDATTSQDYPSAHETPVFAQFLSTGYTSPQSAFGGRLGWYSFGELFTLEQVQYFDAALVAFYAAIGRT